MNSTPSATDGSQPSETPVFQPPDAPRDPEALVREAFDDIALVTGGVAVLHHLDDDLIWTLMRRLDGIRVRLLRDLKGLSPRELFDRHPSKPPRVHAAVEEFLFRNRAGMGE